MLIRAILKRVSAAQVRLRRFTHLPEVEWSSTQFGVEAFTALKSKSGFIIKNLAFTKFSSSTVKALRAYENFLKQSPEEKNAFLGKEGNSLQGFYPYGSFLQESKVSNRYYIRHDVQGKVTHPLPIPPNGRMGMKEATDQRYEVDVVILKKTLLAIEEGFGLKQNEFSRAFDGCYTIQVAEQYPPFTQETLQRLWQADKLTKTEDGRFEIFLTHKDVVPLTILSYRWNENPGFECNISRDPQKKEFKPLDLKSDSFSYNLEAVVVAGMLMENLTDGVITGLEHRVVATPMKPGKIFQREALNSFFFLNSHHSDIKPIVQSATGPHFFPVSTSDYTRQHGEKHLTYEKKHIVKELRSEDLTPYPTESEIQECEHRGGIAYKRLNRR
jgi:isopenicillin N synthase-like dioxygenase